MILKDFQIFPDSMNREINHNHRSNSVCSKNSFEEYNVITQERASIIVLNPQYQIRAETSHEPIAESNNNNQEELVSYF